MLFIKLRYLLFFVFVFLVGLKASFGNDSKLLFFNDEMCSYCRWWEKDIGEIYPKTEYSDEFKLIRISIEKEFIEPSSGLKKPILGTPTFVFIYHGAELGRIEGYNGPEMFWWQVESIIDGKIKD